MLVLEGFGVVDIKRAFLMRVLNLTTITLLLLLCIDNLSGINREDMRKDFAR